MTTSARRWGFQLDRFDLHSRAAYDADFEHIEGVFARFAATVRDVLSNGHLSAEGAAHALFEPKARSTALVADLLEVIRGHVVTDTAAIDATLHEPEPLRPVEVMLDRQYRAELLRAELDGQDLRTHVARLKQAVEAEDAVAAEVVADLVKVEQRRMPTGNANALVEYSAVIRELTEAAELLRASGDRRAALAHRALLEMVDSKVALISSSYGPRLSVIESVKVDPSTGAPQLDNLDPCVGFFRLDFPLPPGFNPRTVMFWTPEDLRRYGGLLPIVRESNSLPPTPPGPYPVRGGGSGSRSI